MPGVQLAAPLAVLAGHSKAVSYVRWLDGDTLITGSTDNCLKLWPLSQGSGTLAASRTFSGKTPNASTYKCAWSLLCRASSSKAMLGWAACYSMLWHIVCSLHDCTCT